MKKQKLIEKINKIAIETPFPKSKIVDHLEVIKLIEQLDEPEKVKVPQFVADWYEENKDDFEGNLFRYIINISSIFDGAKLNEFDRWFLLASTKSFQTLVNMHQFGYEVEEEKRYYVKMLKANFDGKIQILSFKKNSFFWSSNWECYKTHHTRKQLEEADFGWVFDCPGIEVEEVEG